MNEPHILDYVQVLLAVFVFAFGVPSLVLQLALEGPVRDVAHRRLGGPWVTMLSGGLLLGLVSALWFGEGSPVRRLLGTAWQLSSAQEAFLITGGLLAVVLMWVVHQDFRRRLAQRLRTALRRSVRKCAALDEEAVEDLIALGVHSGPGSEKKIVLDVVADVLERAMSMHWYRGEGIAELIGGVPLMLGNEGVQQSSRNLDRAAEILLAVRAGLQRMDGAGSLDSVACEEALAAIASRSVAARSSMATVRLLDADSAALLLAIGNAGIRTDNMVYALAALRRLESLDDGGEYRAARLGLLARFWRVGGVGRDVAERALGLHEGRPLDVQMVAKARRAYYEACDFETANALDGLLSIAP